MSYMGVDPPGMCEMETAPEVHSIKNRDAASEYHWGCLDYLFGLKPSPAPLTKKKKKPRPKKDE